MPTAVCSPMGRYGSVVISRSLSTKVWLRTNIHYHEPMTSTPVWQEESHSRSLDLSHAYLQLPLDEGSRDYVTINTHKGLFRYTRSPYGISVAPSIFQRTLDSLLYGIPRVCIFDILVTGKTREEHVANLRLVLKQLDQAGLN